MFGIWWTKQRRRAGQRVRCPECSTTYFDEEDSDVRCRIILSFHPSEDPAQFLGTEVEAKEAKGAADQVSMNEVK